MGGEDGAVIEPAETTLGRDIRALRMSRKMTLEQTAKQLGRSVGWLSQIERDLSTARVSDLQAIARLFDVPMSLLFGAPDAPPNERGRIVRANGRRVIGDHDRGLVEALVSPDLTDSFEVVHSTFQPGARRDRPITRATQEVAFIVSGRLKIWLDEEPFTVAAGDSFRIRGQSYRWANPYDDPAVSIWVISPPVY